MVEYYVIEKLNDRSFKFIVIDERKHYHKRFPRLTPKLAYLLKTKRDSEEIAKLLNEFKEVCREIDDLRSKGWSWRDIAFYYYDQTSLMTVKRFYSRWCRE